MKSTTAPIMPLSLRQVYYERKDTEGRDLFFDMQFEITNGEIAACIAYLASRFPEKLSIIPIGGLSAGSGVFAFHSSQENLKVGLYIAPPASLSALGNIAYSLSNAPPAKVLKTSELHINLKAKIVYVGAGVTLDQINGTIKNALGKNFLVLGADLTSSGYASAGATFMTGGMGPSRINFAQNIAAVSFFTNGVTHYISDESILQNIAETYGYTGVVQTVVMPIVEMPPVEFGFALPINNTPAEIAQAVGYFEKHTKAMMANGKILTSQPIIMGMEFITLEALQLLPRNIPALAALLANIEMATKNAVLFITGYAGQHPTEDINDVLGIFAIPNQTGLALEHTLVFEDLRVLKTIREGAPDMARNQFADAKFTYKHHTDINIVLSPTNVKASIQKILGCYQAYEKKIGELIKHSQGIEGNVQMYGHFNPQGVDPHYRISLAAEDEKLLHAAEAKAKFFFTELVHDLSVVCSQTNCILTGGEKGIISNQKIIEALQRHDAKIPKALWDKYCKQKKAIRTADSMFAWRSKI